MSGVGNPFAPTMLLLQSLAALALLYVLYRLKKRKSLLSLPPGPPSLPLIGNVFNIPRSFEWRTYHQWSKDIGTPQSCCSSTIWGLRSIFLSYRVLFPWSWLVYFIIVT